MPDRVADVGRSLYVRLSGADAGNRAAGKWTDSATLQHGDLLDLIAAARSLDGIGEALDEARRFLGLAGSAPSLSGPSATNCIRSTRRTSVPAGSAEAARRLFRMSQPLGGTLAGIYLRERGIDVTPDLAALRFHPQCRPDADSPKDGPDAWPALIAAVTDRDGAITGIQ